MGTCAFTDTPDQALLMSAERGYVKNGESAGQDGDGRPSGSMRRRARPSSVTIDGSCSDPTATVRFYFDTEPVGPEEFGVNVASLWWSNPVSVSLADLFAARP